MSIFDTWDLVKALPVKQNVSYELPQTKGIQQQYILCRSEEKNLPRSVWNQIRDSKIRDDAARDNFVRRYFTVCVYELRQVESLTIPMMQEYSKTVTISHESLERKLYESNFLIENVLNASYSKTSPQSTGGAGYSVSEQLKTSYSIKNLSEYTDQNKFTQAISVTYKPTETDRCVVWWDAVKVLVVYREAVSGNVELVGIGDYLFDTLSKTYTG